MTDQCQAHDRPITDCPWEITLRSPSDDPGYEDRQYVCSECSRVFFTTEVREE